MGRERGAVRPGCRSLLSVLLALVMVSSVPLALAGPPSEDGLELTREPAVVSSGEVVQFTVTNNGTQVHQGVPTIEILHFPVCSEGMCAPQEKLVWNETRGAKQLAPGDAWTFTWDLVTMQGGTAAPGIYETHLTWEESPDTIEITSRRFRVQAADNALAPQSIDGFRVDQEPIFTEVRAGENQTVTTQPSDRGLVMRAGEATTVELDVDEAWRVDARPAGLLLTNQNDGEEVLLVSTRGPVPSLSEGRILAPLPADGVLVVRGIEDDPTDRTLANGILDGDVGAEIRLGAETTTIPYGPVQAQATMRADHIGAIVSSDRAGGQSVILELPANAPLGDSLQVTVDGEPAPMAKSLRDALNPDDDGDVSEAYVVEEPSGERYVVVSIDHFSAREVVIETAEEFGAFVTPGVLIGALVLVGASAWGLLRRPEP